MQKKIIRQLAVLSDIPLRQPEEGVVYKILPKNYSESLFQERVDREIGNRTMEEIMLIASLLIAEFGAGGMGGSMVLNWHRAGGKFCLVLDPGSFDRSNRNRQVGAKEDTEGKNKALETVRMAREISPDTTYYIVTESMTEEVWKFLKEHLDMEISLIYDEIELFEAEARLTLHEIAKAMRTPVINCNTVFYESNFFLYDYSNPRCGMDLLKFLAAALGKSEEWTEGWRKRKQRGETTEAEDRMVKEAMVRVLIPRVPEYSLNTTVFSTIKNWHKRLSTETVIVTATNPPGAGSLAVTQGMLYLLNKYSSIKRDTAWHPRVGYFRMDFARMKAKILVGRWYMKTSWLETLVTRIANFLLNTFR